MRKVCLVTGGPRGIGRATALRAAQAGYDIALAGLPSHADDALSTVRDIEAIGARAISLSGDVADPAVVDWMFAETLERLGPLSGLVNAAGRQHHGKVEEFSFTDLTNLMAVNVIGLMMCCRNAARQMSMLHGGAGGAIVNVSSMAATIGGREGASAYAASKGAVDVFSKGFAKEVAAEGIRVNVVRPGATATPMTANIAADPALRRRVESTIPMKRLGRPEEVAEAIIWLLSDAASFVTGACVDASGGGFLITGATEDRISDGGVGTGTSSTAIPSR